MKKLLILCIVIVILSFSSCGNSEKDSHREEYENVQGVVDAANDAYERAKDDYEQFQDDVDDYKEALESLY